MGCESCGSEESVLMAHNAGITSHDWSESGEESDCSCGPHAVCLVCDALLIKQHGFLIMDSILFGPTNDTLQ